MANLPAVAPVEELQALIAKISDVSKDYTGVPGAEGGLNRLQLSQLAKQLMLSVMEPGDAAYNHLANSAECAAVRALLDLKVLDNIPPEGSISLKDLAEKTKTQPALIERLLRMVVCTGFAQQLENLEYAHTKFSFAYTQMPGPGWFFVLAYDEAVLMVTDLHMYLREKGAKEPIDQKYSPYTWKAKQEGTDIWTIMAQDPERLKAFQAGLAFADSQVPLTGYYDFSQLQTEGDRPILVDVGGGPGGSIVQILKVHPDLPSSKFVLQDLEEPIALARSQSFLPKDVVTMVHDFWTPQPVKGAKSYLIRRTLHDYSDPFCIKLLTHIAHAMSPDSVLLIADMVLTSRATPDGTVGAMFSTIIMNMGGKERTPEGFQYILKESGLEFVKIWSHGAGQIVEARLPKAVAAAA